MGQEFKLQTTRVRVGHRLALIGTVAVLGICCLLPRFASAQENQTTTGQDQSTSTTRTVRGVVTLGGKPVPGAIVHIKDTKTLQVRSYVTQEDGSYHFYGLSTNNRYELYAKLNDNVSQTKGLGIFDDRKESVLDLKLK